MNSIEIGEYIRYRRTSLNLRQQDLSEMSGINMKTIQQVELGKGNPSFQTLLKLFSILGLSFTVGVQQTK